MLKNLRNKHCQKKLMLLLVAKNDSFYSSVTITIFYYSSYWGSSLEKVILNEAEKRMEIYYERIAS